MKGNMGKRPRIGITMRLEMETRRFYLGRDYSEAVTACGGIPVHIALIPQAEYINEALADLDGILLPGSNTDVDPFFYGEEPHPNLGTVIPEKDQTDRLVLEEAERLNLPFLGICFGMQALNVWRGGSLIQDIRALVDNCLKHDQGTPYDRNSHSIELESGSILAEMNKSEPETRVNTSHHQAIARLGANLRTTAWAPDGVIEGVEDTREGRFVVGVQWHPEMTFGHDAFSRKIFERFVEECRARSEKTLSANRSYMNVA